MFFLRSVINNQFVNKTLKWPKSELTGTGDRYGFDRKDRRPVGRDRNRPKRGRRVLAENAFRRSRPRKFDRTSVPTFARVHGPNTNGTDVLFRGERGSQWFIDVYFTGPRRFLIARPSR